MPLDLYYMLGSPPCAAVLLTAKAIGVDLNIKNVDLVKGEHKTPEFLKISPQHTVPILVDKELAVSESRAIMTYLVSQYGKDDSLYPKDPKKRVIVDQRLYFDLGTLYARLADYYYPVFYGDEVEYNPTKFERVKDGFGVLNSYLQNQEFLTDNHLTLADIGIAVTVSVYEVYGFKIGDYPNVIKWYEKIKQTIPGYQEINGKSMTAMKGYIDKYGKK